MSDRAKIGAGVVAVGAAILLFVVLQGSDDDSNQRAAGTPAAGKTSGEEASGDAGGATKPRPPEVPVIRIQGGEPKGGIQELTVTSGDRVRFRVVSDTAGEVHVHGYDDEKSVAAGGSISFDFPASLEGGYEIELHHGGGHSQIGELRVQPG